MLVMILQAEDNYAACLFNNWNFALLQDDCRDIQLWSCDHCRAAYRSWLCSQVFVRCQNSDPYQRVKTCRDDCFVSLPLSVQLCESFSVLLHALAGFAAKEWENIIVKGLQLGLYGTLVDWRTLGPVW